MGLQICPQSSRGRAEFRRGSFVGCLYCPAIACILTHAVQQRICFQIEEAQWYYEDFVRGHNTSLPTLNLRAFSAKIFQHCPSLQEWKDSHEQALNQFIAYKTRVPVRGGIMLNHNLDQCVLVRGMKSSASWSFPRGKINQDEKDELCAVREVLEETGFDASKLINPEWYIEQTMRSQNMRLYIIPGVPMDFPFAPRTRNEIGVGATLIESFVFAKTNASC